MPPSALTPRSLPLPGARLPNDNFRDGGANGTWFNGSTDVDGYRVYRSTDFQYSGEGVLPAFRGAAWTLIADIPRAEFARFFNTAENKYRYLDQEPNSGSATATSSPHTGRIPRRGLLQTERW